MSVRVSVENDYTVVIAGVHALLSPFRDRVQVVAGRPGSPGDAPVDVVLFDTFASPADWQARCSAMALDPMIGAVAVYSAVTDPRAIDDAFASGATGYLSKSLSGEQLVESVERVAAGERVRLLGHDGEHGPAGMWPIGDMGLTPRESEMLALIAQGLSNEEIATVCYLSINTVKTYIREAYRKIGVTTRPQAVAWAMRSGLAASR
ncbi:MULTISPECIES: response regulator transcription factor [unclassified Dietzia]|uniref:helix-turn-helix transcriptional regulator n=2 Tax=Dietzia TaxID=37914 RepID=UPI000D22BC93|nr:MULTISPECIES: response regulator transcription factor [unclassified Dietzia]AVZ38604.1 helix-turn-helix transcriptional regulator [Dietzia sp. JS16-p6b]MBB1025810.1 response regulator transcription factor [Dietzia sp. DQ12-76]QGW23681.1 regulatory protein, LuxR [Dietzia sp. DQ12-45-1b]